MELQLHEQLSEYIKKDDRDNLLSILASNPSLIEKPYEGGCYPIFLAASTGNYELVKYLIEYSRVSMNIWDDNHGNVLHYAAKGNNPELFDYLINRVGVNPLEVNLQSHTALDVALSEGSHHIIQYYKEGLGIEKSDLYTNPVLTGAYPDPSVICVGDDFYMVTSSFTFFPCIPVLHSSDLVNWKTIGHAITETEYIDLTSLDDGRGFWAPDISYHEGRFYITATLRYNDEDVPVRKQMILSSDKPEGPYSKPAFIEEDGIDPSLFVDDDGRRYMLLNRGARIFELSQDATKKIGEPTLLWYGNQKRAPEAPHLLKKDGYYYVFVSEGGTGRNHQIAVARSRNLLGPYENCPYNPILHQKDPDHPIQRSGHGKLLKAPDGRWFILYLTGRMVDQQYSILGRESSLDEVTWTGDGWPIVNNLKGPSGVNVKPFPLKEEKAPLPGLWFCQEELEKEWIFVRRSYREYLQMDPAQRILKMVAGSTPLSEGTPRNVMVQRQKAFCFDFCCHIRLSTPKVAGEAGLTCYYDRSTYLTFSLVKEGECLTLQVKEHEGLEDRVPFKLAWQADQVELQIRTDYYKRAFYYKAQKEQEWILLGELPEVYYLSDEGGKGKRFTGAMFGLYTFDEDGSDQVIGTFQDFTVNNKDSEEVRCVLK
ncbi:family 43 glycosylhydrolase [Spirochaeta cellobiosiphila]|uniref:family 43 glycosylhydrolase n=1 Tax=Spirochaeta cellobiosiphila TaxID=504483 RepID=UPI000408E627|nr:family 43 glycosylhydrolase [Spirochaeta cellobiosiphila]